MTRAAVLMFLALTVAACGRPGPPSPPQPDQFAHTYPKPETLSPGEHVPNIPIPQGPAWEGQPGY